MHVCENICIHTHTKPIVWDILGASLCVGKLLPCVCVCVCMCIHIYIYIYTHVWEVLPYVGMFPYMRSLPIKSSQRWEDFTIF